MTISAFVSPAKGHSGYAFSTRRLRTLLLTSIATTALLAAGPSAAGNLEFIVAVPAWSPWGDPLNWNTGTVPTAGDTVTIGLGFAGMGVSPPRPARSR